jgi:hypothetical protein
VALVGSMVGCLSFALFGFFGFFFRFPFGLGFLWVLGCFLGFWLGYLGILSCVLGDTALF